MSNVPASLSARFEPFNLLDIPVWLFDTERTAMVWANKPALVMWGADTLDSLLSRDFSGVSESSRIRMQAYREGFARGQVFFERWTFYPQGKPVVVDCRCSGLPLEGIGTVMLVQGTPVTQQESEREALRMVEALRHTQVLISLYRKDGTPLLRNAAGIKTFGLPAEGDRLDSHFADPAEARRLHETLAAGDVYSAETEMLTLQGPRWMGMDARLTTDPVTGEEVILLNKIDISRRRVAEDMRTRAVLEAENANRAKTRFLANMSHELRTPMHGVIAMTGLLLNTPLSQEQRLYVETIQNSGQSLLNIISDLLDISKIDAGRLNLVEAPYDLKATIDAVVHVIRGIVADRPVMIETEVAPELPPYLYGDGSRIKQILLNLVGNAGKFTSSGHVRIRAGVAGNGERLRFEVEDTGIGIAAEDVPKLFHIFSQLDTRDTRNFEGAGLGLAICKQLVTMMKGEIGVQSSVGKGSVFWFEVPLQAAVPVQAVAEPVNLAPTRPLSLLMAEDNLVNQSIGRIILGKLGHKVTLADDGAAAVRLAEAEHFDLIFMDLQMPVMNGYQATEAIRAGHGPNVATPIIALTANAMDGTERMCLQAGMNDYLSKPVTPERFAAALRKNAPR